MRGRRWKEHLGPQEDGTSAHPPAGGDFGGRAAEVESERRYLGWHTPYPPPSSPSRGQLEKHWPVLLTHADLARRFPGSAAACTQPKSGQRQLPAGYPSSELEFQILRPQLARCPGTSHREKNKKIK